MHTLPRRLSTPNLPSVLSCLAVAAVAALGTTGVSRAQTLLADINPGGTDSLPGAWIDATSATVFVTRSGAATSGEHELWRSDGTAAGTQPVEPLFFHWPFRTPIPLVRLGNEVLYRAMHQTQGRELWITDGTPGDARSLGDLNPGPESTDFHFPVVSEGRAWMGTWRSAGGGNGLLVTDGTAAGTRFLTGIPTPIMNGLCAVPGGIVYAAQTAAGLEPVFTDGTALGTRLLRDIEPGTASSSPQAITTVGGRGVFMATTSTEGRELWTTDGTTAGTKLLADLTPGVGSSSPRMLASNERVLWMEANASSLIRTDGTPSGTRRILGTGRASEGAMLGDDLVYVQALSLGNYTLSVHDGVTRSDLGTFHFIQELLSCPHGEVAFVVRTASGTLTIWSTDGTVAGTRRIDTLPSTPMQRTVRLGTAHRGKLFVVARDAQFGLEPFVFDLTGSVEHVGQGCARSGRLPQLDADQARIGGSLNLRVTDGAPNTFGLTLIGPVPIRPIPLPGSDCSLLVDPVRSAIITGATDNSGRWSVTNLPIPLFTPLVGLEVAAQSGFDVAGVLEFSNAVHAVIGQ